MCLYVCAHICSVCKYSHVDVGRQVPQPACAGENSALGVSAHRPPGLRKGLFVFVVVVVIINEQPC